MLDVVISAIFGTPFHSPKNFAAMLRHLVLSLLLLLAFHWHLPAQAENYSERKDPTNAKRTIVEFKPVTRDLPTRALTRNLLDNPNVQRAPITYVPFELKNPRSGKALNPSAALKITMPDGRTVNTTVKAFYDQVNAMEKALCAQGRSLRMANAFADFNPNINPVPSNAVPSLSPGYQTISFNIAPQTTTGPRVPSTPPANVQMSGPTAAQLGALSNFSWKTSLYVAASGSDHGTNEFPAEWSGVSLAQQGRTNFPFLIQVPDGMTKLVQKIDWMVSDMPFDDASKVIAIKAYKKQGTLSAINWNKSIRGTLNLPDHKNSSYAALYINFAEIEPLPTDKVKPFYVRAVLYNQAGEIITRTPQVVAMYGNVKQELKMTISQYSGTSDFNYGFPSDYENAAFGIYLKGTGFNSVQTRVVDVYSKKDFGAQGYALKGGATLGVKYYNFERIVDSKQPINNDFVLLSINLDAAAGNPAMPVYGQQLKAGARLSLNVLNGLYQPYYEFKATVPGMPNTLSLDYTFKETLDVEVFDYRFFIGPVPVRVYGGVKGEASIVLSGFLNMSNFDASGKLEPYVKTALFAGGGVDAVIAYALVEAQIDPLLHVNLPVSFVSQGANAPVVDFNQASISGLGGKVLLKAGFYYPCPDLGKIVGFVTGDEPLPLCECAWEYNIFQMGKLTHQIGKK